jgi:hypothetical protein
MYRITTKKTLVVEVLLFPSLKNAKPQIQAEYDLAFVGEVESVHGPFSDPPKWMVIYKDKVSAKKGARIRPKD